MYWLDEMSPEEKQRWGISGYNLKMQQCTDSGKQDLSSNETPPRKVDASFTFVSGLSGNTKYRFAIAYADVNGSDTSSYSPWSYSYRTKNEREPVSAGCRRKMWANFYTDPKSPNDGLLLPQRCLGCRAQGRAPDEQGELSPLLTNVHAAHVISFAKGGPEGTDAKHAWNFVPLCESCNLDMKTEHLIDWFYRKCIKQPTADTKFDALFEVLYRLQRACAKMVGPSWKSEESITHFAKKVYKNGCPELAGYPETPEKGHLKFSEIKAGYKVTDHKLKDAALSTPSSSSAIMGPRIDRMDVGASNFARLGSLYMQRVADTSHNIDQLASVTSAGDSILSDAKEKLVGGN